MMLFDALTAIIIDKALNSSFVTSATALDLSELFDMVWHRVLLHKLSS